MRICAWAVDGPASHATAANPIAAKDPDTVIVFLPLCPCCASVDGIRRALLSRHGLSVHLEWPHVDPSGAPVSTAGHQVGESDLVDFAEIRIVHGLHDRNLFRIEHEP